MKTDKIIQYIGKAEYNAKKKLIEIINDNVNVSIESFGWFKKGLMAELDQFITDAINEKIERERKAIDRDSVKSFISDLAKKEKEGKITEHKPIELKNLKNPDERPPRT